MGDGTPTTDGPPIRDRGRGSGLRALALAAVLTLSVLAVPLGPVGEVASAGNTSPIVVAVDGSGDYTSIQDAVDAASSGDTIQVEPGTYEGKNSYEAQVVVDKSGLTIRGDPGDSSRGPGPDAPYLNDTLGPTFNLTENADGTTIVGFDGADSTVSGNIGSINSQGVHLDNITIEQNRLYAVGFDVKSEGEASSYSDIEISKNVLYGDGLYSINFETTTAEDSSYDLSGINVSDNRIEEDLWIRSGSPTTVDDVTIADNRMAGLSLGFDQENKTVSGVSVERNVIEYHDGTEGIHLDFHGTNYSSYQDVTVANNTLELDGVVTQGILFQLQDGDDVTYDVDVVDNVVNESQTDGMIVETRNDDATNDGPTTTVSISGNEIHDNGDSAIRFLGYQTDGIATPFDVSQNVFEGNGYGITNNVTGAVVDARNNYWGSSDGPSSRTGGPLADPVNGALADGSGQTVSEDPSDADVANVRFDPYLSARPGSSTPAYVSVSVDGTNAPVTEGDALSVDVTVENTGNQTGTEAVELVVDGAVQDSTSVTLDPGDSTSVSLSWVTTSGDAGDYTASVRAGTSLAGTGVTVEPASTPTDTPSPTDSPTDTPTDSPAPTDPPTDTPSPTDTPTDAPTDTPTDAPTATATDSPTATATDSPTATESPTATPTTTASPTAPSADDPPSSTPTTTATGAPGFGFVVAVVALLAIGLRRTRRRMD